MVEVITPEVQMMPLSGTEVEILPFCIEKGLQRRNIVHLRVLARAVELTR